MSHEFEKDRHLSLARIINYSKIQERWCLNMLFYYHDKMPLRILDEGDFWKHQEAEHTQVIRALSPDLEPQFVTALEQWEQEFTQTHGMFVRWIETVIRSGGQITQQSYWQILQLVRYAMEESERFITFLDRMSSESQAIRSNPTAMVVVKHIRRESEYFIGISQALLQYYVS